MKSTKRKSKTAQKTVEPVVEATPVAPQDAAPVAQEASAPVAPEAAAPVKNEASAPTVTLSSHCTIKDAAKLKVDLCAVANEPTDVELDVSGVERIDTASMQLLCAFVRDRAKRNQKVIWKGESQGLSDAVRLLGTSELLGYAGTGT
jgi:hypothetical protein